MDELTLLRDSHRDTQGPSAAETAAARARLLAAIGEAESRGLRVVPSGRRMASLGRLARSRFWAAAAAAAAVTAVAITGAVIAVPGPRAARPAHPSASRPPSAASVLREAASAAARQAPGHGRFFAAESELLLRYPALGPQLKKSWIGNGIPGRLVLEGRPHISGSTNGVPFGTSPLTWAQLQHLPTTPGPLLADIAEATRQGAPHSDVHSEFSIIIGLLYEAPAPPALRSALYRAAAMLPGITLIGPSRDLIGRAATEVYLPPDAVDRLGTALFLDPDTGAVLSEEDLYLYGARCSSPLMGWAALASGYVSSNYRLPPGASGTVRPVVKPTFNPGCPARTPQ
jgi:hypothetical protein